MVVDGINEQPGIPDGLKLRRDFAGMSPTQQWRTLMFGTVHCQWEVDYGETSLAHVSLEEPERLREELPELFGEDGGDHE